jgi:hypothetical protein
MSIRVLVCGVYLAIAGSACKSGDRPQGGAANPATAPGASATKPVEVPDAADPMQSPAAKAFFAAESAFQATAKDGPPEAFAAAAKKLDGTIDPFIIALGNPPHSPLVTQLSFVGGILETLDVPGSAQAKLRLLMAQKVHDHLAGMPLAPLPYPSDPTVAKEEADALAAASTPHGDFSEAIGKLHDVETAACACTDRACLTKVMKDVETWGAIYADLDPTPAQGKQIDDTENAMIACAQRVNK